MINNNEKSFREDAEQKEQQLKKKTKKKYLGNLKWFIKNKKRHHI